MPEPRILHQMIVVLIVKVLLAEPVAVELLLLVSSGKLEAIACL